MRQSGLLFLLGFQGVEVRMGPQAPEFRAGVPVAHLVQFREVNPWNEVLVSGHCFVDTQQVRVWVTGTKPRSC